ncbi:hypothetical protein OG875_13835 [Streptomyces sp. NBC_01498]|uniref:hypothetical protein n=1 Tax=Streptomyces sp. NBC_01498 TaxID=2975870 RepID=UPI002E7BF117|nr:hypothetical protein [Streptomyces sp. NBC_01498]WTL25581.1 hypothetical protein OG875_13835 [Streptomyces sp. NBC_01498]
MPPNTVRETKATLNAGTGRVLAWHNDKEARAVSLAVPGDRAKLSATQARELGLWLIEASEAVMRPNRPPLRTAMLRTDHVARW